MDNPLTSRRNQKIANRSSAIREAFREAIINTTTASTNGTEQVDRLDGEANQVRLVRNHPLRQTDSTQPIVLVVFHALHSLLLLLLLVLLLLEVFLVVSSLLSVDSCHFLSPSAGSLMRYSAADTAIATAVITDVNGDNPPEIVVAIQGVNSSGVLISLLKLMF